jgi:hypothetical protein
MRKILYVLLLWFTAPLHGQSLTAQDSSLFDFWIGEWNLTWTGAEGKIGKGTNRISKILDGKVIQENFSDAEGNFKGISISVYNPTKKTWHQAWADNQGGYFDFEGQVEGEKRIFRTQMKELNGEKIIQRMVFYNIHPKSLTWDWEISRDGGATWQLQWRINYMKRNS